ncbi:MAG TPA: hypothetical protein VGA53_01325 [Candidatus Paceibacterota bacterium]
MPVIQIDSQADRVQAIDVLSDAGETYHRAPANRFIVADRVPNLLRARKVQFTLLGEGKIEGGEGEENAKDS